MDRNRCRRAAAITSAVVALLVAASLDAHDLFLRPSAFTIPPNSDVRVAVLNGTFDASEAAVRRDRLRDLSMRTPSGIEHPPYSGWDTAGKASEWRVRVGQTGTYVLGASTLPRTIHLDATAFNKYLAEDGLPDVLRDRRVNGELHRPSHERYSKHVKAIIQVGDARDARVDDVFGYPAEIIPLDNPYSPAFRSTIRVRAMVDGKPVAGQVLIAGGRTADGAAITERAVRTGGDGVARVTIDKRGVWYVKFVHMRRIAAAAGDSVDYESKWATLTFARL